MRTRRVVTSLLPFALLAAALSAGPRAASAAEPPGLDVQVLQSGLRQPWSLAFLPDGSMLYTQRDALTVTLREPDGRSTVVLSRPAGMWAGGETGLMGIERSADFERTGLFFTCHGYRTSATRDVRVVAWRLDPRTRRATFERTLVRSLPTSTGRHGGCALDRGAGESLFVGTGDAARPTPPQSLTSGGGKVLRVRSSTGEGYRENPWGTSSNAMKRKIWTYGHRNVQGLSRQPATGRMWSAEQGSYRDDEVNLLVKGGNHGWNPVRRTSSDPEYNEGANSPMTDTNLPGVQRQAAWRSGSSTVAASGASFVTGSAWGSLDGAMAVSTLKGSHVLFLTFGTDDRLVRTYRPAELDGRYGRLRAAQRGPDGALYVTTSNGSDDKILRVTPRR
jgi:glucose/arabinose dehydrogenase